MLYDHAYFQNIRHASESSAQVIVPLVTGLMAPRSVLDVGCGDGTWLNVYQENGVTACFGVDGNHVRDLLKISPDRFIARDLVNPFDLDRRFDLVQALAVAEHLPLASAEGFVDSLVRHGDVVLFSAAIPHQGGTGHVNEQWPDYWAELFQRADFAVYDWVRPRIWGEERVAWWYTQNALLFVREGIQAEWVKRLPRPVRTGPILRLVHPRRYLLGVSDNQTATETQSTSPRPPSVSVAKPAGLHDVAVVIPTVGRSTLERAVRSVYNQAFPGTIQILLGIDVRPAADSFDALIADAPSNCTVTVFDPGYSTSVRHGGVHAARDGGALRTILSYAAHSRLVAYLDDDNWWAPDHLSSLTAAVAGRGWAYSLRWYVDPDSATPLCIDRWESLGPDAGCYREQYGGFVDANCLLIDKTVCEPTLRLWCHPLPGDKKGMSSDRSVLGDLRQRGPAGSTGRATVFYTLNPTDVMHPRRLKWIAPAQESSATNRGDSAPNSAEGFTADWFSHNLPVWKQHLLPLAGQPIQALEIGVFEGRSAIWLLEHILTHPASTLTWVDTFQGSPEHVGRDLSQLEVRFRANIARFGGKATGHVGRSQDVLRGLNGEQFNLIYIDGSHEAADVLADAVLAWPLLRPGGLLGFDDYRWRQFPEPERCPGIAVDGFLAAHKGRYKEIHRGYQLWIQKIC